MVSVLDAICKIKIDVKNRDMFGKTVVPSCWRFIRNASTAAQ